MIRKASETNWPLLLSGVLGWLVVLVLHGTDGEQLNTSLIYFAFGLFLVAYLGINLIDNDARKFKLLSLLIALQFIAVLLIVSANNAYILYILLVIIASQLPFVFNNRQAYGLLISANLIMVSIFHYYWHSPVTESMIQFIIFFSFEFFAFTISLRATQESSAREKLELMNAELVSTRALLKDSILKSERLKISRDLHDICGHQLTALILNLEYRTFDSSKEVFSTAKLLGVSSFALLYRAFNLSIIDIKTYAVNFGFNFPGFWLEAARAQKLLNGSFGGPRWSK